MVLAYIGLMGFFMYIWNEYGNGVGSPEWFMIQIGRIGQKTGEKVKEEALKTEKFITREIKKTEDYIAKEIKKTEDFIKKEGKKIKEKTKEIIKKEKKKESSE